MPFEKKGTLKLRCGGVNLGIRQNSDLCRLMNFKKPISYGVVFLSLFGNNILNRYPCAYIMQVLTGQYPTLYTYKYSFDFNDFKYGTLKEYAVDAMLLPKATQVIYLQTKIITQFAGVNMGSATLRIFQGGAVPTGVSSVGAFTAVSLSQAPSDNQGSGQASAVRTNPNVAGTPNLIGNYLAPTQLIAKVFINGSGNMSGLTAGQFWLWVTTMKLP